MKPGILFIAFAVLSGKIVAAQSLNPAQQLAYNQAKKMKDSVGINEAKRQKIYKVNLEIFYRKRLARSQYANHPAFMRERVRYFENQRDSLYHYILQPESKFLLYKSKKDLIINAN